MTQPVVKKKKKSIQRKKKCYNQSNKDKGDISHLEQASEATSLSFENIFEGKIKMFSDIEKLKKSITRKLALQKMLKDILLAKGKLYQLVIWIYTKNFIMGFIT